MSNYNTEDTSNSRHKGRLISASALAELLSVSRRTLSRLQSKGALPPPIRLGRSVRWRLDIVTRWIEDGCPNWHSSS